MPDQIKHNWQTRTSRPGCHGDIVSNVCPWQPSLTPFRGKYIIINSPVIRTYLGMCVEEEKILIGHILYERLRTTQTCCLGRNCLSEGAYSTIDRKSSPYTYWASFSSNQKCIFDISISVLRV